MFAPVAPGLPKPYFVDIESTETTGPIGLEIQQRTVARRIVRSNGLLLSPRERHTVAPVAQGEPENQAAQDSGFSLHAGGGNGRWLAVRPGRLVADFP